MSIFIKNLFFILLYFFPDTFAIKILYFFRFNRVLDLNNPISLNQKINWRKIYQRDQRFVEFADKIAVKKYVSDLIGKEYVVPTLWVGKTPYDIPFGSLVAPYVIKTNHGSGNVVIVQDSHDVNIDDLHVYFKRQLMFNYGKNRREWAYYNISPQILIEKMLKMPDGSIPNDYKFFVYHGVVHYVQVDSDRYGAHEMAFLDRNWNKLPVVKSKPQILGEVFKPLSFELMVELAEKIGAQFDFVRIDFYDTRDGVFFGEATFYPAGGLGRFYPYEWDEFFGMPWCINCNSACKS